MELNEAETKILKAIEEARKLLQKECIGMGGGTAQIGISPTSDGSTADGLNTAQKETNKDQLPLVRGKVRGKLREKEKTSKKVTKAIKVIPKDEKGESHPEFIDPKPGDPNWRVLVNKKAIENPAQFIADKNKKNP